MLLNVFILSQKYSLTCIGLDLYRISGFDKFYKKMRGKNFAIFIADLSSKLKY